MSLWNGLVLLKDKSIIPVKLKWEIPSYKKLQIKEYAMNHRLL